MGNTKKNLCYQTILQVLNTCLPLITSPYLSRVLGADKLGVFSYTQAVVSYFTLIAMLGVVNYGTRSIAMCNKDRKQRSVVFWSIYAFQFFMSIVASVFYVFYIVFFLQANLLIAWIQGIYILASLVDITWFYFGIEDFRTTVKISMLIRITSVLMIIFFVNEQKDLWIYTMIMAASVLLSNALLWIPLLKKIDIRELKNIKIYDIIKHIKPNLVLFVPLAAMSIYHVMDKTMLGSLSSFEQTGFYYNADKIINIPLGIITGIGTVMLPRITYIVGFGDKEQADKLFKISIEMIVAISSAMTFGIAAISVHFVPFFFGKGFDQCISLVVVLSPVLIIKGLSYISRMQYLIPNFKESIFIESVFVGAIVNLIINLILIPRIEAMGAVIGTLVAELISCLWQYFRMSKYIKWNFTFIKSSIYVIFGLVMFSIVRLVSTKMHPNIIGILVEVLIGIGIYGGLCLIYWLLTNSKILASIIRH